MDRRRLTEATKTKLEWCVIAKEKIRNRFEKFRKKIVTCFFLLLRREESLSVISFCCAKMGRLTRLLQVYGFLYPQFLLYNLFNRLLILIYPSAFKNRHNGTLTDDWLSSNRFVKTIGRVLPFQAERQTDLNGPAIDVDLYSLSSKSNVSLLQFMKKNRPLVLNFGSCT